MDHLSEPLPCLEDAKAAAVAAEFKEGVLKVHLPKGEQAKPKPLEIKVG
jgi:HSP20 family protein